MRAAPVQAGTRQAGGPSRAYWLCQAGGWLLLPVFSIGFNAHHAPAVLARLTGVYLWAACAGLLLTHGWRAWLRRSSVLELPGPRAGLRVAPRILGLALAMALVTALGFVVFAPFGPIKGWDWLAPAVLSWVTVLGIWTLLYCLGVAARRTRQLRLDTLRHQAELHQAELRALQAKVNPHFFFNSLNSLRGLVFENQEAAARMIDQIATLMRYSLGSGEQLTVPLEGEMHVVRAYLAIEQIRFEERLRVTIDIAPGLEHLPIAPMTLQPLVENAVKYGVEPNPAGSEVRIRARRLDRTVELSVSNQGAISSTSGSTRIGLDNVRRRLALSWPGASLTLTEADGWVTACVRLEGAP